MNTGILEVDTQHQELYARLNRLMEAASQGKGRAEIAATIEYLQEYVLTHFRAEEGYMRDARYPEHMAHKQLHDDFVADFLRFKAQFEQEGPSALLFIQIQRRVVDWVRTHIAQADKRFAQFMQSAR